jgi:hypothetical protein
MLIFLRGAPTVRNYESLTIINSTTCGRRRMTSITVRPTHAFTLNESATRTIGDHRNGKYKGLMTKDELTTENDLLWVRLKDQQELIGFLERENSQLRKRVQQQNDYLKKLSAWAQSMNTCLTIR